MYNDVNYEMKILQLFLMDRFMIHLVKNNYGVH